MNAYVDASVLVRLVFAEPGQLASWGRLTAPVSSELVRVECLRALDRARLLVPLDDATVAERRSAILELIASFELLPVSTSILERAADPFPTTVGSLDAIHLATALDVRSQRELGLLVTHDHELGVAARAVGFAVDGI